MYLWKNVFPRPPLISLRPKPKLFITQIDNEFENSSKKTGRLIYFINSPIKLIIDCQKDVKKNNDDDHGNDDNDDEAAIW